jgi:hypothetical protein
LDAQHGQHDRDIVVDIEEAPVRWQCPEAGLEMPAAQNAFRCNEGKIGCANQLLGYIYDRSRRRYARHPTSRPPSLRSASLPSTYVGRPIS